MIDLTTVAVGKPRALAPAIEEYERRAARYWRFAAVEVAQARGREGRLVMEREAVGIRKHLRPGRLRVALTRPGRRMTSVEFADWLQDLAAGSLRGVHFIVGGAFGIDARLQDECDLALSLSSFTLPHELARLTLAEQIYRAGTIVRREPYHKGCG